MYRILLLGDSISIGYREFVKLYMQNIGCEVIYPYENGKFAAYTYRMLYDLNMEIEDLKNVDLIYWNNGLWDVVRLFDEPPQTDLCVYREYISRIMHRLRKICPNAKIIFATSTSVIEDDYGEGVLRLNRDIEKYNDVARETVEYLGGQVHDLYQISTKWPKEAWEDATHFTETYYKRLSNEIVNLIQKYVNCQRKTAMNKKIQKVIEKAKTFEYVAIYPYGKNGVMLNQILREAFVEKNIFCIDNFCNIEGIYKYDEYKITSNFADTLFVITVEDASLSMYFLECLLRDGVNSKNICIFNEETLLGSEALKYVLSAKQETILDIGCGNGIHSRIFKDYGKKVTAITASKEGIYTGALLDDVRFGKFEEMNFTEKYDVVWASHILEHIRDIHNFLLKIKDVVQPGGIVAITVPANEAAITLSHIHQFNAGRILRYLLEAGFSCVDAKILEYGFNLSVILPNVCFIDEVISLEKAEDGSGDFKEMDRLFDYLPNGIKMAEVRPYGIRTFNGNIQRLNWE